MTNIKKNKFTSSDQAPNKNTLKIFIIFNFVQAGKIWIKKTTIARQLEEGEERAEEEEKGEYLGGGHATRPKTQTKYLGIYIQKNILKLCIYDKKNGLRSTNL